MRTLLKGGTVFYRGSFSILDLLLDNGIVIDISPNIVPVASNISRAILSPLIAASNTSFDVISSTFALY